MLKVGLTGNIGSGKSIICQIFGLLGVPVYNADMEAKRILDSQELVPIIIQQFGEEVVGPNHTIDKKKMAALVFENKFLLDKLNSLIHPLVMNDFESWCRSFSQMPYVINESAILVETGLYKKFDKLIMVSSPENIRIERVMKRDGCTKEQVLLRMNNQLKESDKTAVSDFKIMNNEKDLVIPQVLMIHQALTKKSTSHS